MLRFKDFIQEHVISIGLNPKHAKHREGLRGQIHSVLQKAYSRVDGGYGGQGSGSDAESKAIHGDISSADHIKATVRNGTVSSVNLYKKNHGRKSIATGFNREHPSGKADWIKNKEEDKKRNGWGEVSGAAEKALRGMGYPQVDSKHAKKLTGKDVKIVDREKYSRNIGGKEHTKTILGFPKEKND